MSAYLLGGFMAVNIGIAIIRILLGVFFILARFRFFYDPSQPLGDRVFCEKRVTSLTNKMSHCGLKKWPMQWAYFIAAAEVLAGCALVVGLLSVPAALGLLAILIYATKCTHKDKVAKQNPVDGVDWVCCYLWTPEPLYIAMAAFIVLVGGGAYSLDAVLFS
jgi:uncharacterized membrane protein YphA (DoxX/SURF4 family)